MTIILEGLNVGKANLQPESMCAFKFFRVTYYFRHEDLSQKRSLRSPSTLVTTFGTFV